MTAAFEMEKEQPVYTRNGKYDARCSVCREEINNSWFRDEQPPQGCIHGHSKPHECSLAMARAHNRAVLLKMQKQGLIK